MLNVTPAKAGGQDWIPAFAGMTKKIAGMTKKIAGMTIEFAARCSLFAVRYSPQHMIYLTKLVSHWSFDASVCSCQIHYVQERRILLGRQQLLFAPILRYTIPVCAGCSAMRYGYSCTTALERPQHVMIPGWGLHKNLPE
jgi:hypothetical protein